MPAPKREKSNSIPIILIFVFHSACGQKQKTVCAPYSEPYMIKNPYDSQFHKSNVALCENSLYRVTELNDSRTEFYARTLRVRLALLDPDTPPQFYETDFLQNFN
jgi:hypothetical protein